MSLFSGERVGAATKERHTCSRAAKGHVVGDNSSVEPSDSGVAPASMRCGVKLLIFVALTIPGLLVAAVLGAVVHHYRPEANQHAVVSLGGVLVVLLTSWFCLSMLDGRKLGAIGIGWDRPWVAQLVGGIVIGGLLIGVWWLVFRWFGWVKAAEVEGATTLGQSLLAILALGGVAAVEELTFRGYAFQLLARWSIPIGLIVSGAFFALTHLSNTGGATAIVIVNLLLGHFLFAACYLRTRSLWLPIGLHAGWNIAQAWALGIPTSGQAVPAVLMASTVEANHWTGNAFGPEAGLGVSLVLAAGLLFVWLGVRPRRPVPDLMADPPVHAAGSTSASTRSAALGSP